MSPPPDAIPLRERKFDWFFIIAFASFAMTSFLADAVNAILKPDPHGYFMARMVHEQYARGTDPLLIANPRFLQTGTALSAFVFGPFYLVMIYAFVRGRNWIRVPAIFYAGMIVESVILYLSTAIWGDLPLFRQVDPHTTFDVKALNLGKVLAFNIPYAIIPLLLVARMWREKPFSRRAAS
jgi:hypothetical protein